MAACQGPSIFSMKREKKDRQRGAGRGWGGGSSQGSRGDGGWGTETGRGRAREACFKLQQFCISHQENGIRFHCLDLMGYSGCRSCISCQDKREITGEPVWGQVSGRLWPGAQWHHSGRWQLSPWWRSSDPQSSGGLQSADRKGGDGGPSQVLSHRLSGWRLSISLPYFFLYLFLCCAYLGTKCSGKRS